MEGFEFELNKVLVETYRSIIKVEEQTIKSSKAMDLSINEMHLIEAAAKNPDGMTISDIAAELDITLPSVTIAINKLEKKGYVTKARCNDDGRKVYVMLTKLGNKVNTAHKYFHEQMVKNVSKDFSKEEKKILLSGIEKLNSFLSQKIEQLKDKAK